MATRCASGEPAACRGISGEDYHRAGGVPAVIGELMRHKLLPHPDAVTANGQSIGANCRDCAIANRDVIFSVNAR